jgi:hypothetical protein
VSGAVPLVLLPKRGNPIHEITDPWGALDLLEQYVHREGFESDWRAFLRDCALFLLPALPPEASDWIAAADEFEAGRLSLAGLTSVRIGAWNFHDARQRTAPLAELSAMRVVMYRLWPADAPDRWHESASHFLHFCDQAGLRTEEWWPLLQARFGRMLGKLA